MDGEGGVGKVVEAVGREAVGTGQLCKMRENCIKIVLNKKRKNKEMLLPKVEILYL